MFRNAAADRIQAADDRRRSGDEARLQEGRHPCRLDELRVSLAATISRKALAAKGIKPVAVEKFNIKDVDMTAQLLKAKEAGAEAVLTYGIGPETGADRERHGEARLGKCR